MYSCRGLTSSPSRRWRTINTNLHCTKQQLLVVLTSIYYKSRLEVLPQSKREPMLTPVLLHRRRKNTKPTKCNLVNNSRPTAVAATTLSKPCSLVLNILNCNPSTRCCFPRRTILCKSIVLVLQSCITTDSRYLNPHYKFFSNGAEMHSYEYDTFAVHTDFGDSLNATYTDGIYINLNEESSSGTSDNNEQNNRGRISNVKTSPPHSQDGESARQIHKLWLFCMTNLDS